jgi:hypothetical protein
LPTTFFYLLIGLMLTVLIFCKTWAMAQFLAVAAAVAFVYFTR